MMRNLLAPYEQRPWAQTNWILVRLWRVRSFSRDLPFPILHPSMSTFFLLLPSILPILAFLSALLFPHPSMPSLPLCFSQTSLTLPNPFYSALFLPLHPLSLSLFPVPLFFHLRTPSSILVRFPLFTHALFYNPLYSSLFFISLLIPCSPHHSSFLFL